LRLTAFLSSTYEILEEIVYLSEGILNECVQIFLIKVSASLNFNLDRFRPERVQSLIEE